MTTITLDISGMTCGHCVAWVTKALKGLAGVHVKDVSVGRATVEFDEAVVTPDRIAETVTASGYPSRVAVAA